MSQQTSPLTSLLTSALAHEEDKLLACIHCGLCLEACPTYVHTGDENDSPRGRIYLMRAVEEGRLAATSATFERHINRCLGCRACESACPAGVEYGQLLEAARDTLASHADAPRKLPARALRFVLRHIWSHPKRLRLFFTFGSVVRDAGLARLLLKAKALQRLAPRPYLALALLESSSTTEPSGGKQAFAFGSASKLASDSNATNDADVAPPPRDSAHAMLFTGCVMEQLFTTVNRATARVLRANGCQTSRPEAQVCCGALHAHAGDMDGARALARRNIKAFEGSSNLPIITNAGGCGAMLAAYDHLLADDPEYTEAARLFSRRVRDVSQQLEATGTRQGAKIGEQTTTYDASCHLLYGQRASETSMRLLRSIPGLRLVPLFGSEVCCGGAGVYNLIEMDLSGRVLAEKLAHIKAIGAEVLATGNPGCHMQIGAGAHMAGMKLRVCHPIELLDESYARAGFYRDHPKVTGEQ